MDEERQPIVMTPELQEDLLGLLPYETEAAIRFTPQCYVRESIPEQLRPVFELRAMSETTKRKVIGWTRNTKTLSDEDVRDMVRYHVTGWDNIINLARPEEKIEFSAAVDGGTKAELFRKIPQKPVLQIMFYLCRVAGITDMDKRALTS